MKLLSALAAGAVAIVLTAVPVHQVQAREGLPQFADLVELAGPAVVNIRTTAAASSRSRSSRRFPVPEGMDENDPFLEFFRRFMPPGTQPDDSDSERENRRPEGRQVPRGVGSGFILTEDGIVMTNHHVVAGADEIFVTMSDNREFKAKLIGSDKRTDVAVVKIEANSLPNLKIGNPEQLRVGEWVLAIGSPFGLENTVTAGIVSAKGRDTGDYLPFIQTDVAVNPGNSGGPLINMQGQVVGINSQIYSRTGGFMGISFAIPIDEAMHIADQLRAKGRVVRGRIGVRIGEVTKEIAEPLGLPDASGAQVGAVVPGAPAAEGGTEAGDIILEFDGRKVNKASDLPRIVGATAPGSEVQMKVWRRGQEKMLTIVVGEMDADNNVKPAPARPKKAEKADASNKLGLGVVSLPEEMAKEQRIKSGVLVKLVEGPAQDAGIRAGDVILSINKSDIDSVPKFNAVVAKLPGDEKVVLLIQREDAVQYVPVTPR